MGSHRLQRVPAKVWLIPQFPEQTTMERKLSWRAVCHVSNLIQSLLWKTLAEKERCHLVLPRVAPAAPNRYRLDSLVLTMHSEKG